jgi:hypothetical protein
MSKLHKVDLKGIIAGEIEAPTVEPAEPAAEVLTHDNWRPAPLRRKTRPAEPKPEKSGTLKDRAHQLSVYLEPPVYNCLRDIAHAERTKLHSLMLEAVDLLLKKRGEPSIRELNKRADL